MVCCLLPRKHMLCRLHGACLVRLGPGTLRWSTGLVHCYKTLHMFNSTRIQYVRCQEVIRRLVVKTQLRTLCFL